MGRRTAGSQTTGGPLLRIGDISRIHSLAQRPETSAKLRTAHVTRRPGACAAFAAARGKWSVLREARACWTISATSSGDKGSPSSSAVSRSAAVWAARTSARTCALKDATPGPAAAPRPRMDAVTTSIASAGPSRLPES
eukprot:3634598-Pyramimonas_sp.AAC.1